MNCFVLHSKNKLFLAARVVIFYVLFLLFFFKCLKYQQTVYLYCVGHSEFEVDSTFILMHLTFILDCYDVLKTFGQQVNNQVCACQLVITFVFYIALFCLLLVLELNSPFEII